MALDDAQQFQAIQEDIKKHFGEDFQKTFLRSNVIECFKMLGKPTSGLEYEAIMHHFGLDDAPTDAENSIKLLFNSARARVLLVAESLEKFDDDVKGLLLESQEGGTMSLEDRRWGFRLGDTVRVKGSMREFKAMQKATLGWTGRLRHVYGHLGYVKSVMSEYDNSVHVAFPKAGTECPLYAGVLEKVEEDKKLLRHRKWSPGEFVRSQSDHHLVVIAQKGLVPVGQRGQVLGYVGQKVLVTFDRESVHEVNPAILLADSGRMSPGNANEPHPRGFQVGDKALVISNMKHLIDNQKNSATSGGWSVDMSSLRGKEITVLKINGLGGLNVQSSGGRAWRISDNSVLRNDEKETKAADLEFRTGDVVRVKIPHDIRPILGKLEVPLAFIEYLRLTGEVGANGDDYRPYVRFCNWHRLTEFNASLLRKPTEDRVLKYLAIKKKIENIKVGDTVHLDVGPPNFVSEVLRNSGRDGEVIAALTNPSTVIGSVDDNTVVIEYEDGSRYKIKKKLLAVPQRFYLDTPEKEVDFEVSRRVVQAAEAAIRHITGQKKVLSSFHVYSGNPPIVVIRSDCFASQNEITTWMQRNRGWRVEILCEGQLLIRSDDFGKVKLQFSSGEESHTPDSTSTTVVDRYEVKPLVHMEARPIDDLVPSDEELGQRPCKYLRLRDSTLGRDVYFPYVVHGRRRPATQPLNAPLRTGNANTYNTYNIYSSQVESISNISHSGSN